MIQVAVNCLMDYLFWHYRNGISDAKNLSKNLLWFLWNFFSINLLLKTLFSPWQKLNERRTKGSLQSFFESLVINTLMRLVGAVIRLIFIFLGLIIIAFSAVLLFFFNILWLIMPAIVAVSF